MTPELQDRWQRVAPPFDGRTVATCDDPTVSDVLDMLRLIVPCLAASAKQLYRFFDWHAHDGFITRPIPVDLATVLSDLQSSESLAESVSVDEYVLTAIYSDSYNWLLRYGITFSDDVDLKDAWPTLDLTVATGTRESEATDLLRERWAGHFDEHAATTWFRNQYGG